MTPNCPHCHKPLAELRAGVLLPPLKARIFDAIEAAGERGISSRDLIGSIYHDRPAPRAMQTVRSHIIQINDRLTRKSGVRIKSLERRRWTLTKIRRRGAAQVLGITA
jgi:hypothetical protein